MQTVAKRGWRHAGLASLVALALLAGAAWLWTNQPAAVNADELVQQAQAAQTNATAKGLHSFELIEEEVTSLDGPGASPAQRTQTLPGETRSVRHTWFQAPNQWRHEVQVTQSPVHGPDAAPRVTVADGQRIWTYEPRDNGVQVTAGQLRQPGQADVKGGLPLYGALDLGSVLDQTHGCYLPSLAGEDTVAGRPAYVVRLGATSCPSADASGFNGPRTVWLDKQTLFILRSVLRDTTDTRVAQTQEITFIRYNSDLPASLFTLVPPPGARVLDSRLQLAAAPSSAPAAPPPAGGSLGRLAFVRDGDVWLKTLPDGPEHRLTTDQHNDDPRWSLSGTWIAFRHKASSAPTAGEEVVVLAADGGARRTLATSRGRDIAWSSSADRLAFIEDDHAVVVDAGGSHRVELPHTTSVAWSPDGGWLAYVKLETLAPASGGQPPPRRASLWRVRSDGTDAQLVFDAGAPSSEFLVLAGWSPDSSHILVWTDRGFSASGMADGVPLEAVPAAGGSLLTIVPKMLAYPDFLAWTPRNGHLALVQGGRRPSWFGKRLAVTGLAGALDGLAQADAVELFPAWSPDGQWLAYTTAPTVQTEGGNEAKAASSQRRIAVMHPDDTDRRLLPSTPGAQDERPRWSADGRMLVFSRVLNGEWPQLWLMRADGADPRLVADDLDVQALTGAPAAADAAWNGFYGHLRWDRAYDWWQPASGAQ